MFARMLLGSKNKEPLTHNPRKSATFSEHDAKKGSETDSIKQHITWFYTIGILRIKYFGYF